MSVRKKGVSIGELSREIINPRVRMLMLFIVLFTLWIVVAVFGMVMAVIFEMYPQSVIPVWVQIPIAVIVGWLAYRKKANITVLSVVAVTLMYISIIIGVHMPFSMPHFFGVTPMMVWITLLFVYCFVASVLPVWTLLQPRDYVNSHQLVIGVVLLFIGVIFSRPSVVAPTVHIAPAGAPPIMPFLFITIACGAISGFHSLVSSGTTSKQIKSEEDARFIGFGGMLTEGMLAVLVLIAVAAGIGLKAVSPSGEVLTGTAAWQLHYSSWGSTAGLTDMITAFVNGAGNMLSSLGIPIKYGCALMGVLVASFAGTTLDTATRIQRYVIQELASSYDLGPLKRRYPATVLAVGMAAALAFSEGSGKGALLLWPLFGTCNQLLAGLALLVATVYLVRKKIAAWTCAVPMVFMMITSTWAMTYNARVFLAGGQGHLFVIGVLMMVFSVWMVAEAAWCLKGAAGKTGACKP
jgi:carbon starvation protein